MLTKLGKRIDEHGESFNKKVKNLKRNSQRGGRVKMAE